MLPFVSKWFVGFVFTWNSATQQQSQAILQPLTEFYRCLKFKRHSREQTQDICTLQHNTFTHRRPNNSSHDTFHFVFETQTWLTFTNSGFAGNILNIKMHTQILAYQICQCNPVWYLSFLRNYILKQVSDVFTGMVT